MKYDSKTNFFDLRKSAVVIGKKLGVKGDKMLNCCSRLNLYETEKGLRISRFRCKDRFCPICNHVKSTTISTFLSQQYDKLKNDNHFIALTLTCKNVPLSDLKATQKSLFKSWTALYTNWRRNLGREVAYERTYECTYNTESKEFHPHIHALIVFPKSISLRDISLFDFGGIFARNLPDNLYTYTSYSVTGFGSHIPSIIDDTTTSKSVVWDCELYDPARSTIFEFSKYLTKFKDLVKSLDDETFLKFYELNKSVPVHTFSGEWLGYMKKIDLVEEGTIFVSNTDPIIQNANSVYIGSIVITADFCFSRFDVRVPYLPDIFEYNPFFNQNTYNDIRRKYFDEIKSTLFGERGKSNV